MVHRYEVTLLDGRKHRPHDTEWASSRSEAFSVGSNWVKRYQDRDPLNHSTFRAEVFDRMAGIGEPSHWCYENGEWFISERNSASCIQPHSIIQNDPFRNMNIHINKIVRNSVARHWQTFPSVDAFENSCGQITHEISKITEDLNDQLSRAAEEYRNLNAAYQQLADLYAETKQDADRYRFLRLNWDEWTGNTWNGSRQEIALKLDQAIDSVAQEEVTKPS